jgi:hypothetical protein
MNTETGFDSDWEAEGFDSAAGFKFQLMFEANRLGRPLTPEEVEEFKKKRPQ